MQFKHAPAAVSAVFDDPNLVSSAGLVPMLRLARSAGLDELAHGRLCVPTGKGRERGLEGDGAGRWDARRGGFDRRRRIETEIHGLMQMQG
jgi:hypothetical protein